jgi:peptidoglycan/LPS O-acetylase OafA/YrhL
MTSPSSLRLRELDALRGIATVLVLLFHYTVRYQQLFGDTPPALRFTHGGLGVQLFFGISGFVILMTLERCQTAGEFVLARFSRLYPTYWAAALFTFAVLSLFPLPGRTVTWPQLLINLSMLQEFVHVPSVDGAYWSLAVELAFYAMALAAFMTGELRHGHTLLVGWVSLAIAAGIISKSYGRPLPTLATELLLLPYAPFFAIGAAAYIDFFRHRLSRATLVVFAAAPLAAALNGGPIEALTALAMDVLFALLVHRRAGFLDTRLLVSLGTISYPLYLVHQNLGYVVLRALRASGCGYTLAVSAAAVLSLAAASTLTFGVERPAMRALRSWRRRRAALTI